MHLDTLTARDEHEIRIASRRSAFGYYVLADSFSREKDSLHASQAFLKIDPYYLFSLDWTPDSIQYYIKDKFKITAAAQKKYIFIFDKVYRSEKANVYNTFKEMEKEDQAIRAQLDACKDSSCFALTETKLWETDSIHFTFLYNYVKINGWPTIANGSLHAIILAIHDHKNHKYYMPLLKKAATQGQVRLSALRLISTWMKEEYSSVEDYISQKDYIKFDVSSLIKNEMPEILPEIRQTVGEHCPARLFFFFTSKKKSLATDWFYKMNAYDHHYFELANLQRKLLRVNCGISDDRRLCVEDGLWALYWHFGDIEEPRLFMYVTFDKKDTTDYDRILSGDKLTTYAIHFDVNKAEVKQESMGFIQGLADWLKNNPQVRLEIAGHTDGDGNKQANIQLSRARAEAVKDQLLLRGIEPGRFIVKGFGDSMPVSVSKKKISANKESDRRVELRKI